MTGPDARGAFRLVQAVQDLSLARTLDGIVAIVRTAARELTAADGATFILRDGDRCHYVDEDAISPLWKGQRFPMAACISGWTMLNGQSAVIEDIYADPRIPADAYRPTFVKSLVMVPVRQAEPIAAIGNYWATRCLPSPANVELLQALANSTAVAMENVRVYQELERRVRDRTAQLEEANRELDAFAHSVSHDLRAPLRQLSGFAGLLREGAANLDATSAGYVQRIEGSAQRMTLLIENLLEFSRLGRSPLARKPVDLNAMVADAQREVMLEAGQRAIEWEIADLPIVVGDRAMLYQVMTNLLANAVKYTRHRSPARIQVGSRRGPADEIVVCVRDNGAGFDMQYADKLFGVFQRLHRADQFEGTGVGLANVRRIVARHGGRTWAEGMVDQGAAFYFSLPTSQAAGYSGTVEPEEAHGTADWGPDPSRDTRRDGGLQRPQTS